MTAPNETAAASATRAAKPAIAPPLPTRRDLDFRLPAERIADWNAGGTHVSHFLNTLSLLFPVGERFFIASVRHYRDRITDPELQAAVTAFIGQEAMHGREHEAYNGALQARLSSTVRMEAFVAALLRAVQKLPPSFQLSATIALEHFTAIMADGLLNEPRILDGAEPRFAALWTWHALEETEHKSVAYDVWDTAIGRGPGAYLLRTGGLVVASVILWTVVLPFYVRVIGQEGRLGDGAGWRSMWRYAFGEIGFLRKLVRPWFDYFRPGFHPWDHDNRELLAQVEALAAQVRGRALAAA